MEQLYKLLKPVANIYTVLLSWSLTMVNFYLIVKPLKDYATLASLPAMPTVLDTMNYYSSDEGYQILSNLGQDGRNAYRIVNYYDFVLPVLFFFSWSLSNIALGKGHYYIIAPFVCMIFDTLENIAEKYVLEIFPKRNDFVMNLACYFGLIKMAAAILSIITFIINVLQWFWKRQKRSSEKQQELKHQ